MHYNYLRYYDHYIGRYLTEDPIGIAGGINEFAYVENNPLNWIDPHGLSKIVGQWFRAPYVEDLNLTNFNFDWDIEGSSKEFGPVRFGYLKFTATGNVGFIAYCQEFEDNCGKNKEIRNWYVDMKVRGVSKNLKLPVTFSGWGKIAKALGHIIRAIRHGEKIKYAPKILSTAKKLYPILNQTPTAICKSFPNG